MTTSTNIFEMTTVLFAIFYGSIMNAGFIGAFYVNRKIKKNGSVYLAALGGTDLAITLGVMPICALLMILKQKVPIELCKIMQLFTVISTNTYNLLTMLVAADNYFRAYPGCRLSPTIKDLPPSLMIPTIVLISTVIQLVGNNCELNFDYCDHEKQGNLYFRVAVSIFVHILPAVFSLAAMIIAAKKARRPSGENRMHHLVAEERLHHTITDLNIITYLIYIICWIPCVVMLYINPESKVFKYLLWVGMLRSALGNSMYIIFNKYFRRGFTAIFKSVCCPISLEFIDHTPNETPSSSEELSIHELRPRPALEHRREETWNDIIL